MFSAFLSLAFLLYLSSVRSIHGLPDVIQQVGNQWSEEDRFCEQLQSSSNLCSCFINLETNLLSVHCGGDSNEIDQNRHKNVAKNLSQSLRHLRSIDGATAIKFDELILENCNDFTTLNLSDIKDFHFQTLRIFNFATLKNFILNVGKLMETIKEVEFYQNPDLDPEQLFQFLRAFQKLHTVLLSSINYDGKLPNLNTGSCLPWKRLAFNYRCTPAIWSSGNKTILLDQNSPKFNDLCVVQWLDMTCLNIETKLSQKVLEKLLLSNPSSLLLSKQNKLNLIL